MSDPIARFVTAHQSEIANRVEASIVALIRSGVPIDRIEVVTQDNRDQEGFSVTTTVRVTEDTSDDLMEECRTGVHSACEGRGVWPGPVSVCGCRCHDPWGRSGKDGA